MILDKADLLDELIALVVDTVNNGSNRDGERNHGTVWVSDLVDRGRTEYTFAKNVTVRANTIYSVFSRRTYDSPEDSGICYEATVFVGDESVAKVTCTDGWAPNEWGEDFWRPVLDRLGE